MRRAANAQIVVICLLGGIAQAFLSMDIEVFTDEERLMGFAQHNLRNKKYEEDREASSGEIKKKREAWEKDLADSVADYKAWKSRQKEALDESSEEYFNDLNSKKRFDQDLEKERQEYVADRNQRRAQKKATIKLSEEKEYGLDQNPERVEFRKRELYFSDRAKRWEKKSGMNSGLGSGSGGSGSMDFSAPPPEYNPPTSQPPAPEFFEPEIPPPPPPEFDESIPPPIFEDSPDF